jgi:hypothetical protein
MHIEPPTPRDMLSPKPITSPIRKKYKTTFRSPIIDLKEDEERTCLDGVGGGGGKEFQTIIQMATWRKNLSPIWIR